MKKELNNAECYYEDQISLYFKAQEGMKSSQLRVELGNNYCALLFCALFLKIIKNKVKKRKNDIELINTVNEHLINMIITLESNNRLIIEISSLDTKQSSLKEIHDGLSKRNERLISSNDKYRFILMKKFEVFEY